MKSKIQVRYQKSNLMNLLIRSLNVYIQSVQSRKKVDGQLVYGQLVMLGFDVTTFTPASYQRHRL